MRFPPLLILQGWGEEAFLPRGVLRAMLKDNSEPDSHPRTLGHCASRKCSSTHIALKIVSEPGTGSSGGLTECGAPQNNPTIRGPAGSEVAVPRRAKCPQHPALPMFCGHGHRPLAEPWRAGAAAASWDHTALLGSLLASTSSQAVHLQ